MYDDDRVRDYFFSIRQYKMATDKLENYYTLLQFGSNLIRWYTTEFSIGRAFSGNGGIQRVEVGEV